MSTDPAAVVGSDGQLFSGFGNINDMDFTGGYNNSHSSTMSIETLDLADVLKNPHVKSLHEKWTHATEQVCSFLTQRGTGTGSMILMVSGHEHIGNPNKFGTGERAATY
jgi:hypothetical protein